MIVLYVLLALLGLLLLLLLIPVHLYARYDGALRLRARVLFLYVTLYPRPPKRKKQDTAASGKKKVKPSSRAKTGREPSQWELLLREEGPAGAIRMIADLAGLAAKAAKRILAAVTVDRLALRLVVAAEEPADTAVNYGKACAVLYPALAVLEGTMKIRRRDIALAPDFLKGTGEVNGEVRLHVLPLRVVWALLCLAAAYFGNTLRRQIKQQSDAEIPVGSSEKQTERG